MFRNSAIRILGMMVLGLSLLAACGGGPEPTATPVSPAAAEPVAEEEPAATPVAEEEEAAAETEPQPAAEAGQPAGMRTFVIVPEESQAAYVMEEELFADALSKLGIEPGRQEVVGTTQEIQGQIQLDLNSASPLGETGFTVDLPSLTTGRAMRDDWIRENALESLRYPVAEFTATAVENAPENYVEGEETNFQLIGDLTVREVTRQVTFDVTATLAGDTITGLATTDLRLTDFGITPPDFVNTLTVEDEFSIRVEITAREQG